MVKSNLLNTQYTLNCKGKLLSLSTPIVMGILNATPDSFYNKGNNSSLDELVNTAQQMIAEGAVILDIGAMSSRPDSDPIDEGEERRRLIPVVEAVKSKCPEGIFISIDTYRSIIAKEAIRAGADIINDITGATYDKDMIKTVVEMQVPLVCMHMQGMPKTMQVNPQYEDVVQDIMYYFVKKLEMFHQNNLNDIILDVGFGFGKTLEHNYTLLKHLSAFQIFEKPILAGISRKSMIYKALHTNPEGALNGTTALHMVALAQGAKILRTHDVQEAMECITLHNLLQDA